MRLPFAVTTACLALATGTVSFAAEKDQWYRTEVPPITPKRWTEPAPPIPPHQKVTKEDYLTYIQETYRTVRMTGIRKMGPETRQQWRAARREAFVYQVTGEEKYARHAMDFIRNDYLYRTQGPGKDFAKVHAACPEIIPSITAYHWIRKSPSLTKADHELARKWLELKIDNYAYYEFGAMNRGIGGSASVMVVNHWYPDAADKPLTCIRRGKWLKPGLTRRQYADRTQAMWWDFRDFYENSPGYVAHGLEMIIEAWEATGQMERMKDHGMKRLAKRYLAQLTPNGAMPGYGDVVGFHASPGRWILFMEVWATAYQDGRFKWAAHRLFEFLRRHQDDYAQWGNPVYDAMDSLMEAYLVADESVQPVEPTMGSVMTTRHDLKWFPDYSTAGRHAELLDREIPNKLILRTGWDRDDTYAMVELAKPMSHGHANTASIECYVTDDSILLAAPTYQVRSHASHNCLVAWPDSRPAGFNWKRDLLHGGRCEVQVPTFHKTDEAAYARLHVTDYMNGPTTLDRRVFFMGADGLWVRDTVTAAQPFTGTVGPAFQFVGVSPKRGENWANACQTSVPISFLHNDQYMMQFTNRPVDLLVYYVPRPGAKLVIDDVTFDTTKTSLKRPVHNNFTDRVWYQVRADWKPGQGRTFDSILLPHKPVADATPLAGGIQPLLDEGPDRAAVRINLPDGRTRIAGINTDGKPMTAGPVTTDARYFLITLRAGNVVDHWAVEATSLKVAGTTVHASTKRETVGQAGSDKD